MNQSPIITSRISPAFGGLMMTCAHWGRFLAILIGLALAGESFSADSIDVISITRDSPHYKLDVRIGAGWVHHKKLSISETNQTAETAGWIVSEFKPDEATYKSLCKIPIGPGTQETPQNAKSSILAGLYYITVYRSSGKVASYFVTEKKELVLGDGTSLRSNDELAKWLGDALTAIDHASP
jgi:hypothetical protein